MTNERKAELFDKALGWIYGQLSNADELEYEDTLEEIGFTDEEIAEEKKNMVFANDEEEEPNTLRVCEHCLWAIESREGKQPTLTHYVDADDETESTCMWCEDCGFDTLYEIIG